MAIQNSTKSHMLYRALCFFIFHSTLMKSLAMEHFIDRLTSFATWPDSTLTPSLELTHDGFYYTGEGDQVECHHCGARIGNWQPDDVPRQRHLASSPNCPVALSNSRNLQQSVTVANDISLDNELSINGLSLNEEIPSSPSEAGHFRNTRNSNSGHLDDSKQESPSSSINDTAPNVLENIQGPTFANAHYVPLSNEIDPVIATPAPVDYTVRSNRVRSFEGTWDNATSPVSTKDLVEAGLYFTGPGDRVQCAWCRGGIYNWEDGDTALGEHQKHFPKCPYIRKKIEAFLQEKHLATSKVRHTQWERCIDDHPAVKILLEMGFNQRIVYEKAKHLLSSSDNVLTTDILLEEIYKENGVSETVPSSESNETQENDTSYTAEGAYGNSPNLSRRKSISDGNQTKNELLLPENATIEEIERNKSRLSEENSLLRDSATCKVCLDKPVSVVFLPCRHVVCCEECGDRVKQCPFCRTAILGTVITLMNA